jgi:hypothetical protein
MLRPGRWKSPRVRSSACYLWQVFLFHFISTWNDSKQIHAITSWTFTRTQLTQHIIFIFVKKGDVPIPSQKYKEHYLKNTDLYLSWFPLDTLQKNVRIQSPTIKVSNSGYLGLHATTLNLFSYIYIYISRTIINQLRIMNAHMCGIGSSNGRLRGLSWWYSMGFTLRFLFAAINPAQITNYIHNKNKPSPNYRLWHHIFH